MKAVITGDIIHSTIFTAQQRALLFEHLACELRRWDKKFTMRSETFRGDGFQCLVDQPQMALRIAMVQKTYIRSLNPTDLFKTPNQSSTQKKEKLSSSVIDARIAIGIGTLDHLSSRLASSGGEAFQLSGQLLDSLKNKKQSIAIATNDGFQDELQTEFKLLDAIISKTSALQCEVIFYKLLGHTEHHIAELLKIKQSAVNQRSTNANWNAIETMINRFEKIYNHEKRSNSTHL